MSSILSVSWEAVNQPQEKNSHHSLDGHLSILTITLKNLHEIFSQNGEEYFREIEALLLRKIESHTDTIISTGGGTPCHSGNMDFMLSTGLTIYLKLTPGQLKSRLLKSKGERPLIKDLEPHNLQTFIEKKLEDREEWYEKSDITIEGIDIDVNLLLSLVRAKLTI